MTLSSVQKALILSTCVSGGMFAAAAVPFAMVSSQPVEVQLQNESVFASDLSALSGPYLGAAGVFSVALGAGILGVSGWSLSASKSEQEKAKASELERNLSACKTALERMQFSDTRLKSQNLGTFLEPQTSSHPQPTTKASPTPVGAAVSQASAALAQDMTSPKVVQETVPATDNTSDYQLDALLNQIRVLAAQVETIKTNQTQPAAA